MLNFRKKIIDENRIVTTDDPKTVCIIIDSNLKDHNLLTFFRKSGKNIILVDINKRIINEPMIEPNIVRIDISNINVSIISVLFTPNIL